LTTRGIPQLYYGTEIGLEGDADPYNRRDMRWEIFEHDFVPLPEDTEFQDAREIYEHTRALIRIRRQNPCLCFGYLFTLYVDHFIYVYLRNYKDSTVIVAINNGLEAMPAPLAVNIAVNTNLPCRIKEQLACGALVNLMDPQETIHSANGQIFVQMEGKEAKLIRWDAQGETDTRSRPQDCYQNPRPD
jgi:alpha-amylase